MIRTGGTGPKTARGTAANIATAPSSAKETESASTVDSSRAGSDGGSRENKFDNSTFLTENRRGLMKPIYNGCG